MLTYLVLPTHSVMTHLVYPTHSTTGTMETSSDNTMTKMWIISYLGIPTCAQTAVSPGMNIKQVVTNIRHGYLRTMKTRSSSLLSSSSFLPRVLLYPEEMIQVMLLKPACMKLVYDHLDTVTPGHYSLIVQQQQTCSVDGIILALYNCCI